DEERRAAERRDDADGELRWRDDIARERVGGQQEDAARQNRRGDQYAIVRTERHAERVRHDEPNEADGARKRDHGGRQQGGAGEDAPLHTFGVDAELLSSFLAQREEGQPT